MAYMGVSFKNNKEQAELVRLIYEKDRPIIFCIGKAGTGKTFATLAAALQLKAEKEYGHIIYARNPVQVGEDMGFLPGTIDEKYSPFMGPLIDNLEAIIRISKQGNINDYQHRIETIPIAFLRGRSFEDTIVIVDEAQNLDIVALKTILTRFGKFCKVVLLGSMNQIDDYKQNQKEVCDFQKVINKLKDKPYVGFVELEQSMRNPICTEIDDLLNEIK